MSIKHKISAEVLTPVHIGAGQEKKLLHNVDFFYLDKKIIIIDPSKIFLALSETEKARFMTHLASSTLDSFGEYLLKKSNIDLTDFMIAEIDCPGGSPQNEIVPLISTAGKDGRSVYLPGSSLKGAIRSVLYAYLKDQGKGNSEFEIFGGIDSNLMSFLQVGDAIFSGSRVINAKIFNLFSENNEWQAGWKHERRKTSSDFSSSGFITSYEVFNIRDVSTFTLKINDDRISFLKSAKLKNTSGRFLPPNYDILEKLTINNLFEVINWHSKRYLEAEKRFFQHYDNEEPYCETIVEVIESLLKKIPDDNKSCILHLGCGSGFHGITGDWKFPGDHIHTGQSLQGKILYKSRKLVFRKIKDRQNYDFMPMGFLKLSLKN